MKNAVLKLNPWFGIYSCHEAFTSQARANSSHTNQQSKDLDVEIVMPLTFAQRTDAGNIDSKG